MSPDADDLPTALPYEALFRAAPVAASLSRERDGRLLAVNDAWVALTGLRREAVIGRTTVELGHWLSEAERQAYVKGVRDGTADHEVVLRLGRVHHVRILTTRLDVAPEPLLLVHLHDITAQRDAEQALQQTNLALQQRLELYGALETLARVGHWTNAADDEQVFWSAGLRSLAGLSPEMPLTRAFVRSRIHPDDRTPWFEARQAMDGRTVEFRWQRPDDGQMLWLRSRMARTAVAGNPETDFGVVQDVTAEKQAEQALQRQHRMLQAVQQAQSAFIESDDKRMAFSRLLEALLAVSGSEYGFLGEVLYDAQEQPYLRTHAVSNISWDDASRRVYEEQLESGMEFRNLGSLFGWALRTRETVIANDPASDPRAGGLPPGHRAMHAFLGVPLMVGDRLVAMVGLANQPGGYSPADVEFLQPLLGATRQLVIAWRGHAERKRARLQFQATSALLAEKSNALQITFESMDQGLVQIDADGRIRYYNRRVLELLSLPESLLAAHPPLSEVVRYQAERGDFGENLALLDPNIRGYLGLEPAQMPPERYLRRTQDGCVLEVRSRKLPDGGMVRTYTDVTSYLQAQEQVRALNASLERRVAERTAELERSMKDMEVISYSIAHDLRAPLRSVNGFAALIGDEERARLSPEAQAMFDRITRSSANMGQMITDMLELLRVVRVALQPAPVDMALLARRVIESLASEAARAHIAVGAMPRVMGDATLLRQLLANLLDNALKYSRHREQPELALGYDAGRGAFYLRDNGMGFDMARASKLFGLFQRLHAGNGVPGTGVGLAIVARIIERHEGRIWAESQPNVGTTFWWTLPQA